MGECFIGNKIAGTFTFNGILNEDIAKYSLQKNSDRLQLTWGNSSIELEPVDDDAHVIVKKFSDEPFDWNESIYQLIPNGDTLIVLLYEYSSTIKLENRKIRIHLRREMEKELCSKGIEKIGKVNGVDEIPALLNSLFVNNKSIFVHENKKEPNTFQMYGEKIRASIKLEREGIYIIDRLYSSYNHEYAFDLTQVYGDIDFVTWNDSTSLDFAGQNLSTVKTNEIFEAWDQYMDFEREIYENDLRNIGIIKFDRIEVVESSNADSDYKNLIFHLPDAVKSNIKEKELEYISCIGDDGDKIKLPSNVDEVLDRKKNFWNAAYYIGKCINDCWDNENKILMFNIPNDKRLINDLKIHLNNNGILYLSDRSLLTEQKRRKQIKAVIDSKVNESSNIIMKLSNSNVIDDQLGSTYNPVTDDVLKTMFGKKDVVLKEKYREAMSIALNTPDIALIQGPPGTGKTTLIRGLIKRLEQMNSNFKFLVSSEQHEALYNVVDSLSENQFIPPYVTSKKFESDDEENEQKFIDNVYNFRDGLWELCDSILKETEKKENKKNEDLELLSIIQEIRDNNYSLNFISSVLEKLKFHIRKIGAIDLVTNEIVELSSNVNGVKRVDIKDDPVAKLIERKIEAQRTTIEKFSDDGVRQFKDLQSILKINDFVNDMAEENLLNELMSDDEIVSTNAFKKYDTYVGTLKNKYIYKETNAFEMAMFDAKATVEGIWKKIINSRENKHSDLYDIITDFKYRTNDIDVVAETVKKYTNVIGSTCAQAQKAKDLLELNNDKYDYVIIDEAARANPLDIMIPMMNGIKVIMIGDHKQLPHYIETEFVNKFKEEKEKYTQFDENLLTKSLFQIIYENLEKAYEEKRIKFKRTIQINEQYRMHPQIGTFISNEFYGGSVSNGAMTSNNVNDYGVFDEKNVAWIDLNVSKGTESRVGQSLSRTVEVEKIISLIADLILKNPGKQLDIGLISFYKGQVDLLNEAIKNSFPDEICKNIFCNTVDSYQGREFDIVIVSGVRSNIKTLPEEALGFIHFSPSRVNVALSRAKKLLVVVGDAITFAKTPHFSNFIDYVKKEGYYEE